MKIVAVALLSSLLLSLGGCVSIDVPFVPLI